MTLPEIDLTDIKTLPQAMNLIEELLKTLKVAFEKIDMLEAEVARLSGQPKKPSFPSIENKSSVTNLLKENKKWQKGSKKGKILIDREEALPEVVTCSCGNDTFVTIKTIRKIIQGIVLTRDNVSYIGRVKQCVNCGKKYRSILPKYVRGRSFSPDLSSLISFWHYGCRVTIPLLLRTLSGMGVSISSGQVSNLLMQNGERLKKADQELRKRGMKKSPHLQSDATGAKRKDKQTGRILNQHVQIISNRLLSIFSITRSYNAKTLNRLLGIIGRDKPFISDDGSPNGECLKCKTKQLCLVHEIRHYLKIFPFWNPHKELKKQILTRWREFYHLAKKYGVDPPNSATPARKAAIEQLFDQITSEETGYKELDKQLCLTKKKKVRLLTFLDHPYLPIHNNQCEQDLREFVIIRKISGGTKSYRGDKSLARHLSVIQTAQKQGLDVYQTLNGLLNGTLSPSILTANIH